MAPKKSKDVADENYWRRNIEDAKLDEENWKVKVTILEAADSDNARNYLNKFEIFATEEKRFVIKSISKTETTFMVNQLGGEKKNKEDDSCRVFEEGQLYLKEKKEMPAHVQALIIKHLILKMKEEYLLIKRRRLEVKEGMRRESITMVDRSEIRGIVSVKPQELPPSPPPVKKGKKNDVDASFLLPEPAEDKKYNTQLRVRGEEWRDKVYVDDFPTDGPNLYVAITGFVEPLLPGCLISIGVPITAIVQIRINPSPTAETSGQFKAAKRGQSQTELLKEKSFKFWDDLQNLRVQKDTADVFTDTAFVVFSPPYWDNEKMSGSPDKIYDEVCFLLYDIQDLTRQHDHYLDSMEIINIPSYTNYEKYKREYNQLMNDYPMECITLYTLLDNVLQIVCNHEELDSKSSRSSLSTALTIIQSPNKNESDKLQRAENLVKDVFKSLCKTEDTKKTYRTTQGYEYEHQKDAIIINYGDIAQYSTFQLGNINLDNIVRSSLLGMPINRLWHNVKIPNNEMEAKANFHKNVLLSCFERDDVETSELHRLIHILAFRKLYNNRSSLKKSDVVSKTIFDFKKKYLKRSILAEPLSNSPSLKNYNFSAHSFPSINKSENGSEMSYSGGSESRSIKFVFDCPDISELVSETEIVNEKPSSHLIDDFDYFEDFTGISAFQIILEAFNTFNCVDYKYCEVTDTFVLMFFNSHNKDGIACEEWRSHIPTPLCLQDFFDYTLEEHYEWIQKEEKAYDEHVIFKVQSQFTDLNQYDPNSCLDNVIGDELLIEGSLKHREIKQNEVISPEITEVKTNSKKTITSPTTDTDSKTTKKTKSSTPNTPKKVRRSFILPGNDSEIVIIKKPFLGYDLGNRRVEVFGRDASFFSKDGTKLKSTYTLFLPTNLEYLTLSVTPGNRENVFWFHRALSEMVSNDISDVCNSFRISTKDQVMINIKCQSQPGAIPIAMFGCNEESNYKEDNLKTNIPISSSTPVEQMLLCFSLYVTWPNGLVTETVHEKDSSKISYIKQYYVCSLNTDERLRCVNVNGEVIIFKKSGQVETLRPDGSIIKIINCQKRSYIHLPDDSISENSSEKSKKGKGKDKSKDAKDKSNKTSAKSSKNLILEDENITNPQQMEPELVIEEFDTIDTNGLHEKYIKGNVYKMKNILIRTATDFCLGEIFSRRTDGTNILLNKDGVQVVSFPDGTRIITKYVEEAEEIYPEWSEEEIIYYGLFNSNNIDSESTKSKVSASQKSGRSSYLETNNTVDTLNISYIKNNEEIETDIERNDGYVSVKNIYTIEHKNFTTITVNTLNETVSVESPNKTKITLDKYNHFEFDLDSVTKASFNGDTVNIDYTACVDCESKTKCEIEIRAEKEKIDPKSLQNWLKMRDSFNKKIVVNEEGAINIEDHHCSSENINSGISKNDIGADVVSDYNLEGVEDEKFEGPSLSHGKCRDVYLAKTLRFFVLKRTLTCSELVHRDLLEQYKEACRWQPWCSINTYDVFGDRRTLLSILTPVHLTESEKWLMDSTLADKPKYLTYKDLKKDSGKGFYHWMRPYNRFTPRPAKPENVLPPRLPRAYILRTLEQQWSDKERETLKGAKELLFAVLRYRQVLEDDRQRLLDMSVLDQRAEDERHIDDIIQALGYRIYEDLKTRLREDVLSRAEATITTEPRPKPAPEDLSAEGEAAEGEERTSTTSDLLLFQENRKHLLQESEAAVGTSENLKRYWRRRNEEYKEEQFYRYLLREDNVPPYFRNVLGGAIWWEMNNTAGEAVTEAERAKMNCGCRAQSSRNDDKQFI
ncbi:uncharacterized protein LOC101747134 isoform X1 [Bombyx mori]|uniref:Sperm-associated antigen 17 n=2 Tax=Bombyx mori TaxID=7091 RepID=A0A8R2LYE2_BOMMO|nr:uncharacterized protein LOC101747134 isoform X1 [Bombyx mori]